MVIDYRCYDHGLTYIYRSPIFGKYTGRGKFAPQSIYEQGILGYQLQHALLCDAEDD